MFSSDGRFLYTTENGFENGEDVVVVRNTGNYSVVRKRPSHGVGPHELRWLSDNRALVVANGGILTHPRSPRQKLNIPTMEPSLAYVDSKTGARLADPRLDKHQLSIRYIAVDRQDRVAIALAVRGSIGGPGTTGTIPAGGRGDPSRRSERKPAAFTQSVCVGLHPDRGVAAEACPRRNQVTFWDASTTGFLRSVPVRDTGGITLSSDHNQFLVTSGFGEFHRIDAASHWLVAKP